MIVQIRTAYKPRYLPVSRRGMRGLGQAGCVVSTVGSQGQTLDPGSVGDIPVCSQSQVQAVASGISPFYKGGLSVIPVTLGTGFGYSYGAGCGSSKAWAIQFPGQPADSASNYCNAAAQIAAAGPGKYTTQVQGGWVYAVYQPNNPGAAAINISIVGPASSSPSSPVSSPGTVFSQIPGVAPVSASAPAASPVSSTIAGGSVASGSSEPAYVVQSGGGGTRVTADGLPGWAWLLAAAAGAFLLAKAF